MDVSHCHPREVGADHRDPFDQALLESLQIDHQGHLPLAGALLESLQTDCWGLLHLALSKSLQQEVETQLMNMSAVCSASRLNGTLEESGQQ